MSFIPLRESAILATGSEKQNHFLLMCQLIAAICSYGFWLPAVFMATDSSLLSSDELRVAVAISVGFGQLAMTGFWMAMSYRYGNVLFGLVAIVLETLLVIFFTTISARFLPPSFIASLGGACAIHFLLVWGAAKLVKRMFLLSLEHPDRIGSASKPRVQYQIRDLLLVMAAIAVVGCLWQSNRTELINLSHFLEFFCLVICYYAFLIWPCVIACLSDRGIGYIGISICVAVAIFWTQWALLAFFTSVVGSESWLFFICLELPFLSTLIVHSLVARRHGYRIV